MKDKMTKILLEELKLIIASSIIILLLLADAFLLGKSSVKEHSESLPENSLVRTYNQECSKYINDIMKFEDHANSIENDIERAYYYQSIANEINKFNLKFKPFIVQGLLLTVILLFGFQGEKIINSPLLIFMIAIPLIIQTYGIFFLAYFCAYMLKLPQKIAAPACLIGTSNFFELAVAVSIAIFGINSGAALTTVVGVLVEVPVMLSLVYILNRTSNNFPIK